MKAGFLLLPSLAVVCLGAALPVEVREVADSTLYVTVTASAFSSMKTSTSTVGSVVTVYKTVTATTTKSTKTVTANKTTSATSSSTKLPSTSIKTVTITSSPPTVTVYKTVTSQVSSTVYVTTTTTDEATTTTNDGSTSTTDDSSAATTSDSVTTDDGSGVATIFTVGLGGDFTFPTLGGRDANTKRQIVELVGPVSVAEPTRVVYITEPYGNYATTTSSSSSSETVVITTVYEEYPPWYTDSADSSTSSDIPGSAGPLSWDYSTFAFNKREVSIQTAPCAEAKSIKNSEDSVADLLWSLLRRPAEPTVTVTVTSIMDLPTEPFNQAPFTAQTTLATSASASK